MVLGHKALGNNIQILLLPHSWMSEAKEAWSTTLNPKSTLDYEFIRSLRSYAVNLAGHIMPHVYQSLNISIA